MSRVVFLLVPQVHLLDVAGPAEAAARAVGFADARMLRRLRPRAAGQPAGESESTSRTPGRRGSARTDPACASAI